MENIDVYRIANKTKMNNGDIIAMQGNFFDDEQ